MQIPRKSFLALTGDALFSMTGGCEGRARARSRRILHALDQTPERVKTFALQKSMATSPHYALIEERPRVRVYSPRADEIHAVALAGQTEWVATATDLRRK